MVVRGTAAAGATTNARALCRQPCEVGWAPCSNLAAPQFAMLVIACLPDDLWGGPSGAALVSLRAAAAVKLCYCVAHPWWCVPAA